MKRKGRFNLEKTPGPNKIHIVTKRWHCMVTYLANIFTKTQSKWLQVNERES